MLSQSRDSWQDRASWPLISWPVAGEDESRVDARLTICAEADPKKELASQQAGDFG